MDNFNLNFFSRGQLESLNLGKTFLPLFKILPCRGFFRKLIFAIIAQMLCGNHLKVQEVNLSNIGLQSIYRSANT